MNWETEYKDKLVTVEEAAAVVKSGDRIFFSGIESAPVDLLNALTARKEELQNVELYSLLMMYPLEFVKPEYKGHFHYHTAFIGPYERAFLKGGNVEFTSIPFSHVNWWVENRIKPDLFFVQVSPPNEKGFMSYGASPPAYANHMTEHVSKVIIQVNKNTPFVMGPREAYIHVSEADYICESDREIAVYPPAEVDDISVNIGSRVAELVPDGACIQIGIGSISQAVCKALDSKKDLGIHSELFCDPMIDLMKKGVVNNSKKQTHRGVSICCQSFGGRELYDFLDNNPEVEIYPASSVTHPFEAGKNNNFMAINNALTLDLNGQVCSEALGYQPYSAIGGLLDMVRGAEYSNGGKSIICLPSTVSNKGKVQSRIVSTLPLGTAISIPRTDVHYIVSEYGVADLRKQSTSQKAKELIKIAHPDFREQLTAEAKEAGLFN